MSVDRHAYGSTDWHLPSPSCTPKSGTFPDSSLKTPKTEVFPQSHFLDAWSTPRVNGQQTPAQTPSFTLCTPTDRPSTSSSQALPTPEDAEFHVNHFAPSNLPLPPVDPSRRLSSSPDPHSVNGSRPSRNERVPLSQLVKMDSSQMQTPPPTRHAGSRRSIHGAGDEFATPATVVARTSGHMAPSEGLFSQTPFGFPSLQFSPDVAQLANAGPMSAPPLPHSRLFWDPSNDGSHMDVDLPLGSDPFGPTPHKIDGDLNWPTFHTPAPGGQQMNPQAFQALHGLASPDPLPTFGTTNVGNASGTRASSFASTSAGVDPSMLFSFSSPGLRTSFDASAQPQAQPIASRQPYEMQYRDSVREKEAARKAKGQHSRTSTSSSSASFEPAKSSLQRSNTDSGFRKSRPSSMDSRSSGSAAGHHVPRRSSPLKRQSGGPLLSIPEVRRPRTRLVIDQSGRARTETVPAEEEDEAIDSRRESQNDLRRQYPELWADGDSESEPEDPAMLSFSASFTMPQRHSSKHARTDSGELSRSNSFKIARSTSRPSSGVFDKSSFETVRPVRRVADNANRRFSMMDFPTSFGGDMKKNEDQAMPDSPGDALGALKKVVEGRQKRIDRSVQNTLKAHNQRWAQASADIQTNASLYDPFTNSFTASPATTDLTTPSTDRSSMSGDSTRCICNGGDDGRSMVQCESCNKWLHMSCVGVNADNLPPVYVCIFCTGQTPIARGGRVRGPMPVLFDSPLTHKSVYRR